VFWHAGDQSLVPSQHEYLQRICAKLNDLTPGVTFVNPRVVKLKGSGDPYYDAIAPEAFEGTSSNKIQSSLGKSYYSWYLLKGRAVAFAICVDATGSKRRSFDFNPDHFVKPSGVEESAHDTRILRAIAIYYKESRFKSDVPRYVTGILYVAPKLRRIGVASALFRTLPTEKKTSVREGSESFWDHIAQTYRDYWKTIN
jgi:hypothetical protein